MPSEMLSRTRLNKAAFSSPINSISTTIILQGAQVMEEHLWAVAAFTSEATPVAVDWSGAFLENLAKEIHRPHIDTGETFNSIGRDDGGLKMEGPGSWSVAVGPETQQSLFLEFGFLHVGGAWIQYPFMLPAADLIEPIFTDMFVQIAEVADGRRNMSGPLAPGIEGPLNSFRAALYSYSKFAGDIQVLGFGGLTASRGAALQVAKLTGDANSIMIGAIGHRVSRRVTGRFASGALRASVSARITGPSSATQSSFTRIYNRVSGFSVGRGLGGF